jgi:hypothetical protein
LLRACCQQALSAQEYSFADQKIILTLHADARVRLGKKYV